MRNVSNEYIQTMDMRRDFYPEAEITFSDGTKKILQKNDFAISGNSITEAAGSNSFPIGLVVPKQITLSIMNQDDRWSEYDFYHTNIFLKIKFDLDSGKTETLNVGTFTVITPETYGTVIDITAVDASYNLDRDYRTGLSYPVTIGEAVRNSCATCGVSLLTSTFNNSDFVIEEKPENLTHRQFIGLCAMIAGGNAKFDVYNRLKIMTYDFSELEKSGLDGGIFDSSGTNKYTTGDNADGGTFRPWNTGYDYDGGSFGDRRNMHILYQFKSGLKTDVDDVVITGVQLVDKEKNVHLYGKEGYVLSLENQLAAGKESEVARMIGEKIVGLRFRPFTGDLVAYPMAEFMDTAYIMDYKSNLYQTVLTDVDFQFYGFTTLKCSADSPIRNSSKYYGNEVKAIVEANKLVEKEKTEREKALEELARELAQSSGLYMTEDVQEDGSKIYYMHDKTTLEESMVVWKLTANALGISTDGGKTYPYGLDVTGIAILNRIYAIGIDCNYLTTGAFEIIKNGKTMVLMDKDTGKVILRPDVFELSNGDTIDSIANKAAKNAVDGQTQMDVLNALTNDGKDTGIYLGSDKKLYISFSAARGGNLTLGGANNVMGTLLLKNKFNWDIGKFDNSGIFFKMISNSATTVDNVSGYDFSKFIFNYLGIDFYRGRISGGNDLKNEKIGGIEANESFKYVRLFSMGEDFGAGLFSKSSNGTNLSYVNAWNDGGGGFVVISPELVTSKIVSSHIKGGNYSNSGMISIGAYSVGVNRELKVTGSFSVTGTKSRTVKTKNYNDRLLYCYEMPSPMFGDIGQGQTDENGECYIDIGDIFSETINTEIEYQVFLQKEGEGDIWIAEKNPYYFLVKGTENMRFSWEIKAKQKEFEYERLESYSDKPQDDNPADYESEYMEEIEKLIKEQEELLYETAQ